MPLPRTPEPQPEDPRREAAEYHDMDHLAINQQYVKDFLTPLREGNATTASEIAHQGDAGKPVPGDGSNSVACGPRVIDFGCGPAQIAILLCKADPSIELMGIDNEVEMLEIAKVEIDIAGLLGRVMLQHADVCDLNEFGDAMADVVISNSVLHHLDQPNRGLANAVRLTRPGGRVFIRDLFRPDSEAVIEELVNVHAAGQTAAAKQLLRQSLWAALSHDEVLEMSRGLGIPDGCVQITSDRHWTLDWHKPG